MPCLHCRTFPGSSLPGRKCPTTTSWTLTPLYGDVPFSKQSRQSSSSSIRHRRASLSVRFERAYLNAVECDPVSAFGGIVGLTRELDMKTAERIAGNFTEVLVAPSFAPGVVEFLSSTRANLRVISWQGGRVSSFQFTGTWSGILVQEDSLPPVPAEGTGQWIGKPRPDLWNDLLFAWKTCALSKSNAIVVVAGGKTLGIGRGFTSRVDAVQWALDKAGGAARGAVLASDAFFPFADSIELASRAGIQAIIQPGGSIRDKEVFEAANSAGISLFITGRRTFRH